MYTIGMEDFHHGFMRLKSQMQGRVSLPCYIAYGLLLSPGPFYGHLLYLALPEYSAIPLFLHMHSHAKVTVHEKTVHPHFLASEKYCLKAVGGKHVPTIFVRQHPGSSRDVILVPVEFTSTNLSL